MRLFCFHDNALQAVTKPAIPVLCDSREPGANTLLYSQVQVINFHPLIPRDTPTSIHTQISNHHYSFRSPTCLITPYSRTYHAHVNCDRLRRRCSLGGHAFFAPYSHTLLPDLYSFTACRRKLCRNRYPSRSQRRNGRIYSQSALSLLLETWWHLRVICFLAIVFRLLRILVELASISSTSFDRWDVWRINVLLHQSLPRDF